MGSPTFSQCFGASLCRAAEKDARVCAITAAMSCGTGLEPFRRTFPERFFDVGIAEALRAAETLAEREYTVRILFCEYLTPFGALAAELAPLLAAAVLFYEKEVRRGAARRGRHAAAGKNGGGLMLKTKRTAVMNFESAIRGARNPMNSWARMDSGYDETGNYVLGTNDLDLSRRLARAGSDHRKFLRMIFVSVDITAPLH